jgi:hypothetical protein
LKAAPDRFLGANRVWLWFRRIMLIAPLETCF